MRGGQELGLKLQVTYKVNLKRAKRKTIRFIVDCLSTKLIMTGLVANREMADCFLFVFSCFFFLVG